MYTATPARRALQEKTNAFTSSPKLDLESIAKLPSKLRRKQAKRYQPYSSDASTSLSTTTSSPGTERSESEEIPLTVTLTSTSVLLFGRKTASTSILAEYNATEFVNIFGKNASRVSALMSLEKGLQVLGLNGLKVNGVKLEKGDMKSLDGEKRWELDFFGTAVIVLLKEQQVQKPIARKEPQQDKVDLVGLLISAVVFASRSTVGMSEILSSLPPSVAASDQETLLEELRNGPFGIIENPSLKDASGQQIEPHFYYTPTTDPDKERASAMKPFVKSVRKSQLQAKRYYWAKPTIVKKK